MTLKEKRQAAAALPPHPSRQSGLTEREPEFLCIDEVNAGFLKYRGAHWRRSVYRFLEAKRIRPRRRFRTLLIKKADLLRALEGRSSRQHQRSA